MEHAEGSRNFIFYIRGYAFRSEFTIFKLPLFESANSLRRCSSLPSGATASNSLADFSLHPGNRVPRGSRHMPVPFFRFKCPARPAELPEDAAWAALGSKIYLIGGHVWSGPIHQPCNSVSLSTCVYALDTAADPPQMVLTPGMLNSGKRSPIAWTIGGKIYVMPKIFVAKESLVHFECFDPASESWTVLPSPPFVNDPSKFTIPCNAGGWSNPPLLVVKNYIVLGSSIIIATHEGSLYRFDTAQPARGWTQVVLKFGKKRLNFLPLDRQLSVPIYDGVIFSQLHPYSFPAPDFTCVRNFTRFDRFESAESYLGPSRVEKRFLRRHFRILPGDSYISCLEFESESSLKLCFVKPVSVPIGSAEFVEHDVDDMTTDVARIGEGLVLFSRNGRDRNNEEHYSLNVVRIQREDFVASNLSSVLRTRRPFAGDNRHYICSFLMKDGTFTSGL